MIDRRRIFEFRGCEMVAFVVRHSYEMRESRVLLGNPNRVYECVDERWTFGAIVLLFAAEDETL
jgi:hypothetical protein